MKQGWVFACAFARYYLCPIVSLLNALKAENATRTWCWMASGTFFEVRQILDQVFSGALKFWLTNKPCRPRPFTVNGMTGGLTQVKERLSCVLGWFQGWFGHVPVVSSRRNTLPAFECRRRQKSQSSVRVFTPTWSRMLWLHREA